MTDGHKHREVRMERGTLLWRILQKPLYVTADREWADRTPYPVKSVNRGSAEVYVLTLTGILHRWTGFTIRYKEDD